MLIRDFDVVKLLGQGSYGAVYLAHRLSDGIAVGLKVIDIRSMSKKARRDALNEIRLLASVRHDNILRYYQSFVDHGHLHIATEYCDMGDLESEIKRRKHENDFFDENQVWSFFIQILCAIRALHTRGILHRDLKSANILLCSNGMIKLADFGVAKLLENEDDMAKTRIGTPYYLSPEVWQSLPYNAKSDMWAAGILLYEMMALRYPFDGTNVKDLAKKVVKGQYQKVSKRYGKDLANIVYRLLVAHPPSRPNVEQLFAIDSVNRQLRRVVNDFDLSVEAGSEIMAVINVPRRMSELTYDIPLVPISQEAVTDPEPDMSMVTTKLDDPPPEPEPEPAPAARPKTAERRPKTAERRPKTAEKARRPKTADSSGRAETDSDTQDDSHHKSLRSTAGHRKVKAAPEPVPGHSPSRPKSAKRPSSAKRPGSARARNDDDHEHHEHEHHQPHKPHKPHKPSLEELPRVASPVPVKQVVWTSRKSMIQQQKEIAEQLAAQPSQDHVHRSSAARVGSAGRRRPSQIWLPGAEDAVAAAVAAKQQPQQQQQNDDDLHFESMDSFAKYPVLPGISDAKK